MDFEQARFNMIEQQIRTWQVLDQEVLDLLFVIRRERFVPEKWRMLAFADMDIPLGHSQAMWPPKMEARVLQELAPKKTDTVLEVGTGSGYLTALFAAKAQHVYSVEIIPELSKQAAQTLRSEGISNVTLEVGDAARGWNAHAPYDVIVLTGSVPMLPEAWQQSLNPGGRLFAIVGDPPVMAARLINCVAPGACNSVALFETCIAPLINAPQPERFVF
ncbi:MAG TPA: protein-L-isoaspartate O-methyltransferase [Burkholderiales bacterium]|nr:protein-L-isoaspartate O-methyltransferase [Burkholderiales bacterium]